MHYVHVKGCLSETGTEAGAGPGAVLCIHPLPLGRGPEPDEFDLRQAGCRAWGRSGRGTRRSCVLCSAQILDAGWGFCLSQGSWVTMAKSCWSPISCCHYSGWTSSPHLCFLFLRSNHFSERLWWLLRKLPHQVVEVEICYRKGLPTVGLPHTVPL